MRVLVLPSITTVPGVLTQTTPGGGTFRSGGTLYWENGVVGVLADTNYVSTTTYSLPAGTMATNGDQLVIEADFLINATAGTKSYNCNLGFTSFAADTTGYTGGQTVMVHSTTGTTISLHSRVTVTRLTATTASWHEKTNTSGATWQAIIYGTFSVTWANAQNIGADAKSSASSANNIIIEEFRVTYRPK